MKSFISVSSEKKEDTETIKMDIYTSKENQANLEYVLRNHNLGPQKTSIYPKDNKPYWKKLSKVWKISEEEARRRLCANCEYYNNTPEMMKDMEKIPLDSFDADGGGRGYCHKFMFICHNLRTCDGWDRKEFISEEY